MTLTRLPDFYNTSAVLTPFLGLGQLSHKDIWAWLETSRVFKSGQALFSRFVYPIHARLAPAVWLHRSLMLLQLFAVMATFILATFASTETIGISVVAGFGVLVVRAFTGVIPFRLTLIDCCVGLFFLSAVIATAFSSYMATSLVGLAKFLIFLMGYLNFRTMIGENRAMLSWCFALLVILGFGEALIGFYQYVNHVQPLATWQDPTLNPEDQLTRIFGTLQPSNPNLLAGFLIPCVAAGSGLTLKKWVEGRWWTGALLLGMTVTILCGLVLTGSRGGYLAILAMSLVTFLYIGHLLWHEPQLRTQYKLKALWLFVFFGSIAAAVLAVVLVQPIRTRVFSIFAMREDSSNAYRMNVWASTAQMIKDNWLVGIGPGNDTFKQVYGLYMIPGYNALSAYSIFLEMWVEQGIMGLLLFLLLLITAKFRTLWGFYSTLPTSHKVLIGSTFTGIVGSTVYGLFDTIWYRPSVNLLFWLFVAGLAVYTECAFDEEPCHG